MNINLSTLTTLVPLLAAVLDAAAGIGTAFGWFNLTQPERAAVVTALGAGFALIIGVWTIVAGWVHTTNVKVSAAQK